jgi:hypothetical protein
MQGQPIEKYDSRTGKWNLMTCMNAKRLQCGSTLVDKYLYLVGGREGLKTLNTVECFDMHKQVWTSACNMSTHRHGVCAIYYLGALYAVGGHVCTHYLPFGIKSLASLKVSIQL